MAGEFCICPMDQYPKDLQKLIEAQYIHGFHFKVRCSNAIENLLSSWSFDVQATTSGHLRDAQLNAMTREVIFEARNTPELVEYFPVSSDGMNDLEVILVRDALLQSIIDETTQVANYVTRQFEVIVPASRMLPPKEYAQGLLQQVHVLEALGNEPLFCTARYEVALQVLAAYNAGNQVVSSPQVPQVLLMLSTGELQRYLGYLSHKLEQSSQLFLQRIDEFWNLLEVNFLQHLRWSRSLKVPAKFQREHAGIKTSLSSLFRSVTGLFNKLGELQQAAMRMGYHGSFPAVSSILQSLREVQIRLLQNCLVVTVQPPKCCVKKHYNVVEVQSLLDVDNLQGLHVEFLVLDAEQADNLLMTYNPFPAQFEFENAIQFPFEPNNATLPSSGTLTQRLQFTSRSKPVDSGTNIMTLKYLLLVRSRINIGDQVVAAWTCSAPFTMGSHNKQEAAGTASVLWQEAFPCVIPATAHLPLAQQLKSPLTALPEVRYEQVVEWLCVRHLSEKAGLPNESLPSMCRDFLNGCVRSYGDSVQMDKFCKHKKRKNDEAEKFAYFEWFYHAVDALCMNGIQEPWRKGYLLAFVERTVAEQMLSNSNSTASAALFRFSNQNLSAISMTVRRRDRKIVPLEPWGCKKFNLIWFPTLAMLDAKDKGIENVVCFEAGSGNVVEKSIAEAFEAFPYKDPKAKPISVPYVPNDQFNN